MGAVLALFHAALADYPADKVLMAFDTWSKRSGEFPTIADIVGLIERNGAPPIKESDVIAIRKIDGASRTDQQWRILREWERQQSAGWGGDDSTKERLAEQNKQLRKENQALKRENKRLAGMVGEKQPTPKPWEIPQESKIQNTIDGLRASGASDQVIAEFLESVK